MWLHAFVARGNPCTFRSFPRHERLGPPNLMHPFMTQRWVDCASGVRIHITIMEFHSRERVSLNGCLWQPTIKSIDVERESNRTCIATAFIQALVEQSKCPKEAAVQFD